MTDFFLSDEAGLPVKIDTDLDLFDDAPGQDYPWLLWSFVKFRNPSENGLAGEAEESLLIEMRHGLIEMLHNALNIVYAGSRITDGWFELYFYAPSPKGYENLVSTHMKTYPGYAYESGSRKDPKWEQYLHHLYPDPRQYQQIQTRHTLLALSEEGDDSAAVRPVEHYLFFKTRSNEERFSSRAREAGFDVSEQVEQDDEHYPYGVILEKHSPATFDAIEADIDILFALASKEHGLYEGWSTVLAETADV